jgi:hypothetical protein
MMMKYLIISCLILLSVSCTDKERIFPDLCQNCTVTIDLNGQSWEWDPYDMSMIKLLPGRDSTFAITIFEQQLDTDLFPDIMSFYNMPFDTGIFILDTIEQQKLGGINIEHRIYEVEYDVEAQYFTVIPDGTSYVHIEKLDKSTGEVEFSFHLNMVAEYNDWHFVTYPKYLVLSNGRVKGQINQ